jgi:hypothetical protein
MVLAVDAGRRRLMSSCAFAMSETAVNVIFLIATGFIAFHGLTFRDEAGERDFVRLLFGCIALVFFLRVLLADVLGVWG